MRSFLCLVVCIALASSSGCAVKKGAEVAGADRAPRFAFQNRFWVNLHQRLYAESSDRFPDKSPQAGAERFTEAERGKWDAAVAFYRARIPERGPLTFLERPLEGWNDRIAQLGDSQKAEEGGLDPDLTAQLSSAAEVYLAHGWSADRASNDAWISDVGRRLAAQGDGLFAELERVYQTPWPSEPIEVQVSVHAGFLGAYTMRHPPRVSINSGLSTYRGDYGLEMVLHEASHLLIDGTTAALEAECQRQGKRLPASLWHALLFFSVGEVVRARIPSHTPYAEANGLFTRAWSTLEPLLHEHWLPYVHGKVSREAALKALVAKLPVATE